MTDQIGIKNLKTSVMKIGIIGTGAIGGTLAKKLANAGHEVKVYNKGDGNLLKKRAQELGVLPATRDSITKGVDVVIISVPSIAIPELEKALFTGLPDSVVVVDTSNYYPFRDGDIEELKNGKVESLWVTEQIGRPVIKAFNNLLAHSLENGSKPEGAGDRIAMAVSGNDQQAKEMVSVLINDAGFDAVDAGTLADSWRHQPGTPAYCTELSVVELKQALNQGDKGDAARLRDHAIRKFMEFATPPTHEEVVAMNRSLFLENPKKH
ncbi:NADPH-dependent F420 reductase [Mucilaginibacter sp.]|uniref:NADPH-dependent F420 reductase n=1 Tax=Mucilaginibacter sp. TaxID=1882438 RepID=UPI002ED25FCC